MISLMTTITGRYGGAYPIEMVGPGGEVYRGPQSEMLRTIGELDGYRSHALRLTFQGDDYLRLQGAMSLFGWADDDTTAVRQVGINHVIFTQLGTEFGAEYKAGIFTDFLPRARRKADFTIYPLAHVNWDRLLTVLQRHHESRHPGTAFDLAAIDGYREARLFFDEQVPRLSN